MTGDDSKNKVRGNYKVSKEDLEKMLAYIKSLEEDKKQKKDNDTKY